MDIRKGTVMGMDMLTIGYVIVGAISLGPLAAVILIIAFSRD